MIDFGFDKLALIGGVALIVIGPERLPRVARTIGHLIGKAQRYVSDVKAEVSRSMELEELKKMKTEMETAARDVQDSVQQEIHSATQAFDQTWADVSGRTPSLSSEHAEPPSYSHPKKNWRVKRGATPQWYKQRQGVRRHAQSGAARVARFRPSSARRFP
ncbi:Sec-independent protein translocase protein TatB [Paucibacter sp. DJ1R-11]|uniref:Sec-independent protein translocase protein TatB n=1 Tax=unclassified Roseateles TaxID=2626991 RepID=UPI0021E39015|nr:MULTISPECIES: Sec-independent protein translocase protein TatB [unclassified Roseateles]MCV2363223.1 Sec-independent protein translocase protein TatB [Paucibacter sp. DJ1R-11]MCV2421718.1 Sec-independent protein translocase protein TatB [Paucibacter sp. DJ4R-1]MCV2438423.1 Sec-independent protein translocase protein TatB [Paucibacter sp. DJ2R-2]